MSGRGAAILAAGFLVLFVGGGARFGIGLTLKPMVGDLGWERSTLGLAVAVFMVVSAACMLIAGRLADRVSPRFVVAAGLAASGVGIGLMSLVTQPWQAKLAYGVVFAVGSGIASVTPVGVMVTRAFPGNIGLANAVAMSGMCVGQLVMIAALAGALEAIGWRAVYVWLGAAHLIALPLVLYVANGHLLPPPSWGRAGEGGTAERERSSYQASTPEVPPPPTPPHKGEGSPLLEIEPPSLRNIVASRRFLVLLGIYAVCGFDDFFVATHVVAFAQDQGVEALLAGQLLALMGLAGLIGVVAGGAWSDRSGPAAPTIASFALRLIVFALVLVDQSPLAIAVFALVFGATFLVTAPLTVVFVGQSFGHRHLGALTGLITMVHQLAGGLGAWLGAAVFDREGSYGTAFAAMLVATTLALVLSLTLRAPPERPQNSPST